MAIKASPFSGSCILLSSLLIRDLNLVILFVCVCVIEGICALSSVSNQASCKRWKLEERKCTVILFLFLKSKPSLLFNLQIMSRDRGEFGGREQPSYGAIGGDRDSSSRSQSGGVSLMQLQITAMIYCLFFQHPPPM